MFSEFQKACRVKKKALKAYWRHCKVVVIVSVDVIGVVIVVVVGLHATKHIRLSERA